MKDWQKFVSYHQRFKSAEERFREKYIPEPMSGCWLWMAGDCAGRYGRFHVNGRDRPAHVYSWEAVNGPVPDGLEVCHKCNVGFCVNPDHLYAGSHLQNMRDYQRTVKPWTLRGGYNGYKPGLYVGRSHRLKEKRAAQFYWGA